MSAEDTIIPLRVSGKPSDAARISSSTLDEIDAQDLARRAQAAYAEGERAGFERAVQETAGALQQATERLEESREKAEAEVSEFAIELALRIAREILAREIDEGRYDIEKIVRQALSWSGVGRGSCTVHLNPEDVARLDGIPFRAGTVLEADTDVECGDVHITTPQGLLVRELDECLDSIRTSLREENA